MIVRVVPKMSTGIFFLFLNSYINNKENYIQGNMWLDLCVAALCFWNISFVKKNILFFTLSYILNLRDKKAIANI